jgi:hypothetical protein
VNLAVRLEAVKSSGYSIARVCRYANVSAKKIYYADSLSPEETARIETVLADIAAGEIVPRMRELRVPA